MRVAVVGPIAGRSSYAAVARDYILGLESRGHTVEVLPLRTPDDKAPVGDKVDRVAKLITERSPKELEDWAEARLVVSVPETTPTLIAMGLQPSRWAIHTVWETSELPETWPELLKQYKRVLTSSVENLIQFRDAGIRTGHLVPQGFDPAIYNPEKQNPDPRGFTFLCVADFVPRKNLETLVAAFCNQFQGKERVRLVIKTWCSHDPSIMKEFEQRVIGMSLRFRVKIALATDPLTSEGMRDLYSMADAFILPTRGEGWCRPALQAMACGVPVIITDYGAHTEFVHPHNGVLLPYRMVPVIPHFAYQAPQEWADVDMKTLQKAMLAAVTGKDRMKRLGERAAKDALAYTLDMVAEDLEWALEEAFDVQ